MIREYFDTSRNTQAEYIDFLWERYGELLRDLISEQHHLVYQLKYSKLDDLRQRINTAYDDHYTIHGFNYSK